MLPVRKLLDISSEPISAAKPCREGLPSGSLGEELYLLLAERNGFYAFESALHVRSLAARSDGCLDAKAWNLDMCWRYAYRNLLRADVFFFAEDAFGHQFGIDDKYVYGFNSEIGQLSVVGESVRHWIDGIMNNYKVVTGYQVIHDWQIVNGPIAPGFRLTARVPFVLGGDYHQSNMVALRDRSAMGYWGEFAWAIYGAADGTSIVFDASKLDALVQSGDA